MAQRDYAAELSSAAYTSPYALPPPDPTDYATRMAYLANAAREQEAAYQAMGNYTPPPGPSASEDILSGLPSFFGKIPSYIAGAPADLFGLGMQAGGAFDRYVLGNENAPSPEQIDEANPFRPTTSAALQKDYEGLTGVPFYVPQTLPGQLTDIGIGMAISPGHVPRVPKSTGLGAFKTTRPANLVKQAAEGGFSVHVPTGEIPREGLMSGIYANADPRNTVVQGRPATRRDVLEAFKKNEEVLQGKDKYFGGWADEGNTYLEPSKRFPNEADVRKATKFAEKTKQKAIMRLSDFKALPVGQWEDFVKSDEFVDKLIRMGREGRTATEAAAGPGVEWWDLPVLDEVYGPYAETARKFLATTSANATPAENVRKMTEYMRRYLKEEDIVQPDFRIPETATHFTPGGQMGLEESLIPNLMRSARGEPLSGPSVGGKDRVMNRPSADPLDPRDYVPDRRWARIAEDPERGIFTSGSEGVIRDEEQVTKIGEAIARAAKAENRSVRNLSADVWFALNPTETAQPYNKLIEDAIAQKAPTLGMSVKQFKEALGRGDVELLSILLGTPALAGVAAQVLPSGTLPTGEGGA